MSVTAHHGTIVRLNADKPFGFIEAGQVEFFFHGGQVCGKRWDELRPGMHVDFDGDVDGPKGPRATRVVIAP